MGRAFDIGATPRWSTRSPSSACAARIAASATTGSVRLQRSWMRATLSASSRPEAAAQEPAGSSEAGSPSSPTASRQNGHGEKVDSWVGTGPNREVAPSDLEQAIGPDMLHDLTEQTGLSRDELLSRLSRELHNAVDQYTPHGRLPADADADVA